jgi:ABC-type nitrate/sulfonate/bicarbonate transport system substrate-binding protein
MSVRASRARVLGAGAAFGLTVAASPRLRAAPAYGAPESSEVNVGIPLDATSYLPLYIAAQRTWKEQGLAVQLVAFRGEAETAQALAGDSIHVSCGSVTGLVNLIDAGPLSASTAGSTSPVSLGTRSRESRRGPR